MYFTSSMNKKNFDYFKRLYGPEEEQSAIVFSIDIALYNLLCWPNPTLHLSVLQKWYDVSSSKVASFLTRYIFIRSSILYRYLSFLYRSFVLNCWVMDSSCASPFLKYVLHSFTLALKKEYKRVLLNAVSSSVIS